VESAEEQSWDPLKGLEGLHAKLIIGLGPIVLDFPCISEELTDKSN
jgi:hypothetical protein